MIKLLLLVPLLITASTVYAYDQSWQDGYDAGKRAAYLEMQYEIEKMQRMIDQMQSTYERAIQEYKTIIDEQQRTINNNYDFLNQHSIELNQYMQNSNELFDLLIELHTTPNVQFKHGQININLFDSNKEQYSWSMPVESYNSIVGQSYPSDIFLYNDKTYETYQLYDHADMVGNNFVNVIDDVYENSNNNSHFIWNVWHMISELTIYETEIGDDPRYALETLVRGGGDCEDTSILIADMLNSSRYTKDWQIALVYLDADNPTDPQTINHVFVYVDDGTYQYYIESTAPPDWNYYPNGIVGWYEYI